MMDNNDNQVIQTSPSTTYSPSAGPGTPQIGPGSAVPQPQSDELTSQQKKTLISVVIVIILFFVLLIGSIAALWLAPAEKTAQIRDIFIILMAFLSLLIGAALVILMIQVARLINLLQNEIKPILESTNETISYLRGTSVFLSENLTEPVIKLNEYLAGLTQLFQMVGLVRRSSRSKPPKESK